MTNNKYEAYNTFFKNLIQYKKDLDSIQQHLNKLDSKDLQNIISNLQKQLTAYKAELLEIMKNIKNRDLGDESILFDLQYKIQTYDYRLFDLSDEMIKNNIGYQQAS